MSDLLDGTGLGEAAKATDGPSSVVVVPSAAHAVSSTGGAQTPEGAARMAVERELPGLCTERKRLIRERSRFGDVTAGNRVVVGCIRAAGFAVALAIGVVAGEAAFTAGG